MPVSAVIASFVILAVTVFRGTAERSLPWIAVLGFLMTILLGLMAFVTVACFRKKHKMPPRT